MATMVAGREKYDAYLLKRFPVSAPGSITPGTVGVVSASSLGQGGISRRVRMGKNGQIIINDGSNDRILIGYQKDGFTSG